jgi:beta-glucosidase-like glycosyl hydrolase
LLLLLLLLAVTSDCDADYDVFYRHNFTRMPEESVRDVLRATTDVDCGGFVSQFALSALKKGLIGMPDIDARIRSLWRVRYRLAHFDASSPLNSVPLSVVCSPHAQLLARDGVTQSAVLVKNANTALPFPATARSKVTSCCCLFLNLNKT